MHRSVRILAPLFLAVVAGLASPVFAKGIFQATGRLTEVHRDGETVELRFSGEISFGYATAPEHDPARKWQDVHFRVSNLPILIDDWTEPFKSSEPAASSDATRAQQKLLALMKEDGAIRLSLDNPGLMFSNAGELKQVHGTFIYAAPENPTSGQ